VRVATSISKRNYNANWSRNSFASDRRTCENSILMRRL